MSAEALRRSQITLSSTKSAILSNGWVELGQAWLTAGAQGDDVDGCSQLQPVGGLIMRHVTAQVFSLVTIVCIHGYSSPAAPLPEPEACRAVPMSWEAGSHSDSRGPCGNAAAVQAAPCWLLGDRYTYQGLLNKCVGLCSRPPAPLAARDYLAVTCQNLFLYLECTHNRVIAIPDSNATLIHGCCGTQGRPG